jgi:hypothetical protein
MSSFKKATKTQARLRLAFQGPSGGGKTYSALSLAKGLASSMDKVAVIDTEYGSASKYAAEFPGFNVCEIRDNYNPSIFIEKMAEAAADHEVIIIDSLTHAWNGEGGFLSMVDEEVKRMQAKNWKPDSFAAWKNLTPIYNRLVQAIQSSRCHVIVCLRAKQEYEKTKNEAGKVEVKKVGMAPEMRDNFQYEMDIEGMLTMEHDFIIGKTRCSAIDGKVYNKPGNDFAQILKTWLSDGAPVPPTVVTPDPAVSAKPTWSADQTAEAVRLGKEIRAHGAAAAAECDALKKSMTGSAPTDTIDALAVLLRRWQDIADSAAADAAAMNTPK